MTRPSRTSTQPAHGALLDRAQDPLAQLVLVEGLAHAALLDDTRQQELRTLVGREALGAAEALATAAHLVAVGNQPRIDDLGIGSRAEGQRIVVERPTREARMVTQAARCPDRCCVTWSRRPRRAAPCVRRCRVAPRFAASAVDGIAPADVQYLRAHVGDHALAGTVLERVEYVAHPVRELLHSASLKPRVVTAGVPMRRPLVTNGERVSFGTVFLFTVMWA